MPPLFQPSPVQAAVVEALARLERGERVVERQVLDLKEEAGRRGPGGRLEPGSRQSEVAIEKLAPEVACMANTSGGGALLVGVSDDGTLVGTELDEEWVRARLYAKLDRRLTVDAHAVVCRGTRLLVLIVPEAVEPIRFEHRIRWRVGDACVEIDATTWHARRHRSLGFDWSAQASAHAASEAREGALEIVRDSLRASNDPAANELAEAARPDLLRRLNAVTGDGRLTNAAVLAFVGRPEPCLDYICREVAGGDSIDRVRRADRSLIEQLHEVFTVARAHNPVLHLSEGLAMGQVRRLPDRALREAIVNGIAHREWGLPDATVVEHVGGTLRVTSPGGFFGDVSTANIINHPSKSRNQALTELLAAMKIAEREGIGVDRMFGDMLRLGYPSPAIEETSAPSVVTTLVADEVDKAWIRWLGRLQPSRASADLRILMSLHLLVAQGWVDERTLAPYLQLPVVEARSTMAMLAELTIDGHPILRDVGGVPAEAPPASALSLHGRSTLEEEGARVGRRRTWPTRESVALSYARARGRISTTELGELVCAASSNIGGVLTTLEARNVLRPSRERRRGAGFHYVYVAPDAPS